MNRCPACGTTYPAEAKFCPRDGSRLVARSIISPPAPRNADSQSAAAPPVGSNTPARATEPPARTMRNTPLTPANLVGKVLEGRYRMIRKVGEGGMSFVYLAHDIATEDRYAIKVLSPALSEDANAMARLRREAALGMRLAHPNVCHIMRLGETEDGMVYVVMPFVEGELLADRTNRIEALRSSGQFLQAAGSEDESKGEGGSASEEGQGEEEVGGIQQSAFGIQPLNFSAESASVAAFVLPLPSLFTNYQLLRKL